MMKDGIPFLCTRSCFLLLRNRNRPLEVGMVPWPWLRDKEKKDETKKKQSGDISFSRSHSRRVVPENS
jgi:hypothetical protein